MFYSNHDIVNEIRTETVLMRLLKNGIIHYSYKVKTEITIEQHWENHRALLKIAENTKHPLLIDSLNFFNISNEVKKLIRKLEPEIPIIARAIVTESLAEKLLIRFYNNVQKPLYKLMIFRNYDEAVIWLLSLK